MKEVILILYLIVICMTDDVLKDINSFDTAIMFMTNRQSTKEDLCLNEYSSIYDDIFEITVVLAKVAVNQTDDKILEEAARKFKSEYFRTLSESEEIYHFINIQFLDKNCQTISQINKDNIEEQVIDEFISKRSNMSRFNSAQLVAFSCAVSRLYHVQSRYTESETLGKEQRIVEMAYFSHRIKNDMSGIVDNTLSFKLIVNTELLIEKSSNRNMIPSEYVVKCLLKDAEAKYKLNKLEYIGGIFKRLVDNINENETCNIRSLSPFRQSSLSSLFIDSAYGKFDVVERRAILIIFDKLFTDFNYFNIFGLSDLYEYLKTFLHFPQCEFDKNRFSNDFKAQIQNIRDYKFGKTKLEGVGQVVALYCVLAELRNTPQRLFDDGYRSDVRKIMDIYTLFISGLKSPTEEKFTTLLHSHMNTVRRDSIKIDRSLSESYYHKLEYACMLENGKTSFKDRVQPVLRDFEGFMYDEYVPTYCPIRTWNQGSFTSGVIDRIFGSLKYDFISLELIFENIERFLDQSSQLKDVSWKEFLDFDGQLCSVKKDINYKTYKFDKTPSPATDLETFKESLIYRCSSISSLAKALKDSQQKLSVQDQILIYSAYIHFSRISSQFHSLPVEEKVLALKNHVSSKALASKQEPGRKGLLECEIHRVVVIGSLYESVLFMSIYSLIVTTYFDNKTCSYRYDTFSDGNMQDLSKVLLEHPELSDYSVSDLITYIIPNVKIICQEYNSLFSTYQLSIEFTNRLVNERTCILNEFDDTKLSRDIHNFIVVNDKNQFPFESSLVIKILSCLAYKEIRSIMDKLEDKKKLSSSDITALDEIVSKVVAENPILKERTPENFRQILVNATTTEKFSLLFDSPLKVSLAKCNLRKSFFKDNSSSDASRDDNGSSGNNGGSGGSSGNNSGSGGIGDNNGTTNASGNNDTKSGKNKLSSWAIAGIVIGILFGGIILTCGVIYYMRVRRSH